MNYKTQYYKGIPLNLISRKYKNMKAKRFVINHTNQNVWIPNKHLKKDGTIKEKENIDYVFRKSIRKLELAGITPTIIESIIYGALDHMYCDNCRFNSEIKESDSDEWNCDECHRKYNGWGVSMQESNRIAKEILKQLGE